MTKDILGNQMGSTDPPSQKRKDVMRKANIKQVANRYLALTLLNSDIKVLPLPQLQALWAGWRFNCSLLPPRLNGIIWSIVKSARSSMGVSHIPQTTVSWPGLILSNSRIAYQREFLRRLALRFGLGSQRFSKRSFSTIVSFPVFCGRYRSTFTGRILVVSAFRTFMRLVRRNPFCRLNTNQIVAYPSHNCMYRLEALCLRSQDNGYSKSPTISTTKDSEAINE